MSVHPVSEVKAGIKEVPIWAWGLIGVAVVYLVFVRKRGAAAASTTQAATQPTVDASGNPIYYDANGNAISVNAATGQATSLANPMLNPSDPTAGINAYIGSMQSQWSSQQEELNQEQALISANQDQTAQLLQMFQEQQLNNQVAGGSPSGSTVGGTSDSGGPSLPGAVSPVAAPPVLTPPGVVDPALADPQAAAQAYLNALIASGHVGGQGTPIGSPGDVTYQQLMAHGGLGDYAQELSPHMTPPQVAHTIAPAAYVPPNGPVPHNPGALLFGLA